ncbi:uncharacterized protein LOC117322028 [Pecten maximus]|uniref:uncharacterized protein LOC117322028 n=1 Tax=Pecten maximus TaxID=6579 RepID=UPI001457FC01|nr:uncharacterized protein LOC117322028 [Pecten maximus]XP_033732624.1 uncharacterized protein LOC117322028 [Pecten maximus]
MDNSMTKTITADKQLDKEFFSPPNPRGERHFLLECPPIGIALILASGLLAYRIKRYPVMKAKGHDMQIYLYTTRVIVCGTISAIAALTVTSAKMLDGSTSSRPLYMRDHTPRKLPNQKLKPMTENPMVLIKTNILEQVLLKKFNAEVEVE